MHHLILHSTASALNLAPNNGPSSPADWAMGIAITAHFIAFALHQKNKFDKQRSQKMSLPPPIWPPGFSPKNGLSVISKRQKR